MINKLEDWIFSTKMGKFLFIFLGVLIFGTIILVLFSCLNFYNFSSMLISGSAVAFFSALTDKTLKKWF